MGIFEQLATKFNKWASEEKVIYRERKIVKSASLFHGGKHYQGSHAPKCETCKVTLSKGLCLNRMCKRFLKAA
jgi:hypothetical protein